LKKNKRTAEQGILPLFVNLFYNNNNELSESKYKSSRTLVAAHIEKSPPCLAVVVIATYIGEINLNIKIQTYNYI
jgi:hypothetical protein